MKKKPTPLTVIGWYLIIIYALTLGLIPLVLFIPAFLDTFKATGAPVELTLGFTFLSSAVMIFSGISILKGLKLGKYVALAAMPAAMLVGSLINGFQVSLIMGIIIYAFIFYFLTRKDARMYFNHEWTAPADDAALAAENSASAPAGSHVLVYERTVNGSAEKTILTVNSQDALVKKPSTARMIAGTIFFFFGDNLLISYFAFVLPVTMSISQVLSMMAGMLTFAVVILIAGILILIGFLIFGFKYGRGLIMLGTFFTGAWTVMGALGLIMLQFTPQYRELQELQQNQNIGLNSIGYYLLIAGILNLIIAACFSPEFKRFVSTHVFRRAGK